MKLLNSICKITLGMGWSYEKNVLTFSLDYLSWNVKNITKCGVRHTHTSHILSSDGSKINSEFVYLEHFISFKILLQNILKLLRGYTNMDE